MLHTLYNTILPCNYISLYRYKKERITYQEIGLTDDTLREHPNSDSDTLTLT